MNGFWGKLAAVCLAGPLYAVSSSPPALAQPVSCCHFIPLSQGPFSDRFTADEEIDPRWVLSEPNPNSTVAIGRKGLLLDASAQNGGSDFWPSTNYDASLLLQPIDPALDYTATTRIDFAAVNNYMGAGLVLTAQTAGFTKSSLFHRFEYGDNPVEGLESFVNGKPDPGFVAYHAGKVSLRLQKAGSAYTYSYSPDGKTWTVISTLTDAAAYTYIGLISVRQPYDGQTQLDSRPIFKHFRIWVSKR